MDHLLDNWEEAKDLFINPIFLMCDYDGTLTPIVNRPEQADLSPGMKNRIIELSNYCPIGIISGRALDNLKSKVGIDGIYYSGNHGYEVAGPGIDFVKGEAEEAKEIIKEICTEVGGKITSIDGGRVENKGYTASFHYREATKEDASKIKKIVSSTISPYLEKNLIKSNLGKKVIEIGPPIDWDKGDAVALLRRTASCEVESLPVYLGDDITDEDAFFRLQRIGVGILVSEEERETGAHYRLNDTEEVKLFFDKLLDLLKKV